MLRKALMQPGTVHKRQKAKIRSTSSLTTPTLATDLCKSLQPAELPHLLVRVVSLRAATGQTAQQKTTEQRQLWSNLVRGRKFTGTFHSASVARWQPSSQKNALSAAIVTDAPPTKSCAPKEHAHCAQHACKTAMTSKGLGQRSTRWAGQSRLPFLTSTADVRHLPLSLQFLPGIFP